MKKWDLLKYPLIFGLGFYASRYFRPPHTIEHYSEPRKSFFRSFINERNLIRSSEYERFTSNIDYFSFFEDGLIKKLEGVSVFSVYFQKETAEKINHNDTLQKEEKNSLGKLFCVFSPNSSVQGHFGIVHGGFSAAILDNLLGHLSVLINDYSPCATANLNINFRKPMFVGEEYILEAELEKKIDRKIYIKSRILNEKKEVCLEANSLFIAVDWKSAYLNKIIETVTGKQKIKQNSIQKI